MTSVMKKGDLDLDLDLDLDRKSDSVADEARVSGGGGDVSSENDVNGDGAREDRSVNLGNVVLEELENRTSESDFDGRISKSEETRVLEGDFDGRVRESVETRVLEVGREGVDEEMKYGASDIRNEDAVQMGNDRKTGVGEAEWSRVEKDELNTEEKGIVELSSRASVHKGHAGAQKSDVSMVDEFLTNGKGEGMGVGLSTSVGYGYEIGDMIWGKVKSHPWWPGFIYNESFASPSVRRTKREGHVLAAFFGDSSYGWFEPAELVPFDAHFAEKSGQTNARTFVKAVEEAIDEVSRRRALGLACRCRNPYNFRPTNVKGYFAVDLNDYEAGGVYSVSQIKKSRDGFQPRDTLAFVKQLALIAREEVYTSIEFIKNKATVLAYRKAIYEEFDETYAQAFGQKPVRPSRESLEAAAQPVRAPLSGPMVIAEALGKRKKNSMKPNKAKEQDNKERYLFKRRDEPSESKIHQIGHGTSSSQPAYVEGSAAFAVGDYKLQKSADGSMVESPSTFADSFSPWQSPAESSHLLQLKSSVDNGKGALLESKENAGNNAMPIPTIMDGSVLSGKGRFHGGMDGVIQTSKQKRDGAINFKHDRQRATTSILGEGFQQPPSLPATVEEVQGREQVHSGGHVLPRIDPKLHGQDSRIQVDTGKKKAKLLKRPVGEMGADKSALGEKKKKRKKELGVETSSDLMRKQATTGKGGTSSSLLPDSPGMRPTFGSGNPELKLPQLLSGLHALALNPFHGVESNYPALVQKAFLKFRSLVYQKSSSLSTPAEMEFNEVHAPISPAGSSAGSEIPPRENIIDLPSSSKQPKPLGRPDDPTKSGRKRVPSDRQEESAAKRLKRVSDLKSLAVEKKGAQKTSETHRDGKEPAAPRLPKPLKLDYIKKADSLDSIKKTESPSKARQPTMLVMKFPANTNLPSGSELKARLARFGPLDHSATRVFWQSFTCRVVFLHRADAEAAHRHLTGNNSLFGNVNVRSSIRPMGTTAPESEPVETLQLRDSAVKQKPPVASPSQPSSVQLKSILKKPVGDEAGTATGGGSNGGRGAPRVKFVLEGGESSVGEVGGNKNNNYNNASFADSGASSSSSSSHGMDFISKDFQKVIIPPHPLPLLPLPPASAQLPKPQINLRYAEVAPRNAHKFKANLARGIGPNPNNVDITQQMLGLLMKCNDVVTNVSSFLGYVPYHPL